MSDNLGIERFTSGYPAKVSNVGHEKHGVGEMIGGDLSGSIFPGTEDKIEINSSQNDSASFPAKRGEMIRKVTPEEGDPEGLALIAEYKRLRSAIENDQSLDKPGHKIALLEKGGKFVLVSDKSNNNDFPASNLRYEEIDFQGIQALEFSKRTPGVTGHWANKYCLVNIATGKLIKAS
jgi:hypothetical protein